MPSVDAQLADAATLAKPLPKVYPQFNEDGTPKLHADGSRVYGPEKAKKVKPAKEKKVKLYAQLNEDGTPQLDDEGKPVMGETKPVKPKKEKVVKEPEYARGEDGEFLLDEEGNKIPVRAARTPRLGPDGKPLPRSINNYGENHVLKLTDLGLKTQYRADSKRGQIFASIRDGMTVKEFYEANGGKSVSHTFLVWYVNEAKVVEVEPPADQVGTVE